MRKVLLAMFAIFGLHQGLCQVEAYSVAEPIVLNEYLDDMKAKGQSSCSEGKTCCFQGPKGKKGQQGKMGKFPSQSGTMAVIFSNFAPTGTGTTFQFTVVDPLGNKYFSPLLDIGALPSSVAVDIGPELYSGPYAIYVKYINGTLGSSIQYRYQSVNSNNSDSFVGQQFVNFNLISLVPSGVGYISGGIVSNP